ncbi:MAG: hypothetical protein ACRDS0_05605 [Pseudonocardiaceae bacterium]
MRRLGKGTGKYQVQRKAEIRQAMGRCRSAVPVWILPTYRITDQLHIQPDMFDVVARAGAVACLRDARDLAAERGLSYPRESAAHQGAETLGRGVPHDRRPPGEFEFPPDEDRGAGGQSLDRRPWPR